MSLSYHQTFRKGNSMNQTRAYEASYNIANENLHFSLDQVGDSLSQRAAQHPIHHISISQAHESSQFLQQSALQNSTITSASKDYFQAIEHSLLLQNQNLKNHNRYLLEQVKRFFKREKVMKRALFEHQNTIKTLQSIILDSQIILRMLYEDMMLLIEELQVVNSMRKGRRLWDEEKGRQNASSLYVKQASEAKLQDVFHSLENVKTVFSQSQIMDEKRLKLYMKSTLEHENPVHGQQVYQQRSENKIEQGSIFNEDDWQAPDSSADLPFLCSFKNKILNLCMKISSQANNTKGVYFQSIIEFATGCSCNVITNIIQSGQFNPTMDFLFPPASPQSQDPAKRQAFAGFSQLLKNSLGNRFLSFIQQIAEKPILQRNEEEIAASLEKINKIIDEIHEHITRKLEHYEQEVFETVKEEIQTMNEEVRRLVFQLNSKISQRNENQQVWFLNNELDYFKNQALKLFSENKELRVEMKILRETIKDYQSQMESKDHVLQRIKKKCMKEKSIAKKNQNAVKALQTVREKEASKEKEQLTKRLKIKDPSHKKRMLTEISSMMRTEYQKGNKSFDEESRVNIRISNKSNSKFLSNNANNSPIIIGIQDDNDRTVQQLSIPNLSGESHKSNHSRHNFMEFQPILVQEEPVVRQCIDKSIQTSQHIDKLILVKTKREEDRYQPSDEDTNEARLNLDLFRSGFKLNSTHRKTRRIELPLRSSVDYQKKGMGHLRSMNNSFLKNRLQDSSIISKKNHQASLPKKQSIF